MSVAVRRSSCSPFEPIVMPNIARETLPISLTNWLPPAEQYTPIENPVEAAKEDVRAGQFDIWSSIQSQKAKEAGADLPTPYVHPLVRRSSNLMSQKSLEICTESLGSETGSADFSSFFDDLDCLSSKIESEKEEIHNGPIYDTLMVEEEVSRFRVAKVVGERRVQSQKKELVEVNYHCSISRRSPPRSFPPPLTSISRRDGPCIHIRPHRLDGRLVVQAVPVRSQNYLHAQRQDGRLLLSFIDATFDGPDDTETDPPDTIEMTQQQQQDVFEPSEAEEEEEGEEEATSMVQTEDGELEEEKNCDEEGEEEAEEEEEEEEVEEEVEVVDRGTVVEVKVSTQPQQQSGSMKVQRSSFVINKFVGAGETRWAEKMAECKPTTPDKKQIQQDHRSTATAAPARRVAPTTTTAAAAAAAASTFSTSSEGYYRYYHHDHSFHGRGQQLGGGQYAPADDNKLLFTSNRRNGEDLLHHMRRCSQLRRPLFILEPCCIATSS